MKLCDHCLERLKLTNLSEVQIQQVLESLERLPEKLLPCPRCESMNLQFVCSSIDMSSESVKQIRCYDCDYETPEMSGGMKVLGEYWNNINRE